jgi:hypothetical protein
MPIFGNVSMLLIPVFNEMANYWLQIIDTGLTMDLGNFTHFPTKVDTSPAA